ncbi:MAG: hypothetical protein KBG15_13905 [Kofleriaceae bacterium]|nr:hypothetical protein [Kofleriaceae bacterium]
MQRMLACSATYSVTRVRGQRLIGLVIMVLTWWPSVAHADSLTVGLYAPSLPYPGTAARVQAVGKLAEHFGQAVGGTGVGRVYARASDFAAAVKKAEVAVALVDVAYLAHAGGNYTVIAAAVRGGEIARPWQLVGKTGTTLAQLQGKTILVPAIGGHENDFVYAALFGGELPRNYFAKLDTAPDAVSALAAVGFGKADAVVVPGGMELPAGMVVLLSLTAAADAVVVVYGTDAQLRAKLVTAITSYKGDSVVGGLRTSDAEAVASLRRRFVVAPRRGLMVVPSAKMLVGELLRGVQVLPTRAEVTQFVSHVDFSQVQ